MTLNFIRVFNSKSFQHCCLRRTIQNGLSPSGSSITSTTFRRYFQSLDRRCFDTFRNTPCILRKFLFRNYPQKARNSSSGKHKEMDLVLYTNDNLKFLKLINLFGFTFSAFWFFTSYQYATMHITPEVERRVHTHNLPWFARFDVVSSVSSKVSMTILSALLGFAVFGGAWMYSIRSVGKVILSKNGKIATFVTYNPLKFSMSKTTTVNLNEVSCQGHRSSNDIVPIKIKGKWMHFLLVKEGLYKNPLLFDRTVGLRRNL